MKPFFTFALTTLIAGTTLANPLDDYERALKSDNRDEACSTFLELSERPLFVLAKMATIRTFEYCDRQDPRALWRIVDSITGEWTSPLREQVGLQVATETLNHRRIIELTPEILGTVAAQSEKEELLERAIRSAQEVDDLRSIEKLKVLLYKVAPRHIPNPMDSELLKVARDHRVNLNWQAAIDLYQQVFDNSNSRLEKLEALNGIRFAYKMKYRFHGGALADFLDNAKIMRDFCETSLNSPSSDINQNFKFVDAWAQYARDHWSYGDPAIARTETLALIAHQNVRGFLKARAQYLMSRIHANYNEWQDSKNFALEAIASMDGNSGANKWQRELWDNAHWNAAWAARKLDDLNGSAWILKSILGTTKVSASKKKYAFWLGKTYNDLGQRDKAAPHLEEAIRLAPYHFYGLVAHEQLGKKLSRLRSQNFDNPDRPRDITEGDFARIKTMVRVGEEVQAQKLVANRLDPSRDLTELKLRAFTGDYSGIWRIFFTKFSSNGRNNLIRRNASLIYPRPFNDLVKPWAAKFDDISEEFVYSIMRQESAFNPNTRSWADAYGLLQLLPSVAREVQSKANVFFEEDRELFKPEINIPLGITHMGDLFGYNKNYFILTTASYNGTKEAARRWFERLYRGDSYEFIEDIPFSETRNYVKLVMRNFVMNYRLKNKNAVSFPPHLIELSDDAYDGMSKWAPYSEADKRSRLPL